MINYTKFGENRYRLYSEKNELLVTKGLKHKNITKFLVDNEILNCSDYLNILNHRKKIKRYLNKYGYIVLVKGGYIDYDMSEKHIPYTMIIDMSQYDKIKSSYYLNRYKSTKDIFNLLTRDIIIEEIEL